MKKNKDYNKVAETILEEAHPEEDVEYVEILEEEAESKKHKEDLVLFSPVLYTSSEQFKKL